MCGSEDSEESFSVDSEALSDLYVQRYGKQIRPFMPIEKTLHLVICRDCDLRFFVGCTPGPAEFYRIVQRNKRYYLKDKNEYDLAISQMHNARSVLEIGPGCGEFGHKLKQQGILDYTGLEFSPEAAKMGKQGGLDIRVEQIQDHALSQRDHYDVVCSFQVLEHVPNPKEFLQAAATCLRPGGLLILSVPSEDSYISLLPNSVLNMPPHHQTRWSDRCLHNVARLLGLQLISIVHDTVWPEHVREYAGLVVQLGLCDLVGLPAGVINRSVRYRLLGRITYIFSKLIARGLQKSKLLLPNGHSVTAVYRRPQADTPVNDVIRLAEIAPRGPDVLGQSCRVSDQGSDT
jgi:SAM-dependent methyltransferase